MSEGRRQQHLSTLVPIQEEKAEKKANTCTQPQRHTGGEIKHGIWQQGWRILLFALYFNGSIIAMFVTQVIGSPLYVYNKELYHAWVAMSKQHFGVMITTMTYWWAPVKIRISGDESVRGQLKKTPDERLECDFPERMVLISNHQIYTDWIYLWWISYTSSMHGHLYIILKESIKYIPILGTGMMIYGFIFLSRKWSTDKDRFQYRLKKLSARYSGPLSGSKGLNPMWLLIFPEGTNLSNSGRIASKKWAEKNNMEDLRHVLLPRSTGLSFCLQELKDTVDYMYDCTLAYEGVPVGQYGEDLFSLRSSYFQGQPPRSVNMYWRRFHIADIPTHDEKVFSDWLLARWREKDDILQYYVENNRFPSDEGTSLNVKGGQPLKGAGWIETEVRPVRWFEWVQILIPLAALGLVINVLVKMINTVLGNARVES